MIFLLTNLNLKKLAIFLIGFIVLFFPLVLFGQQTDNHLLISIPAQQTVQIDGDLKEWDLSGTLLCCYDLSTLQQTHSVEVASMYDQKNLYFSFRFHDLSPMENWINPEVDPQGGWKGDAVQIRIKSPSTIAHVTSWYYTPKHQPWVSLHFGMWDKDSKAVDVNDGSRMGVEVAFKKNQDAKGYCQEIAIPWKILGLTSLNNFSIEKLHLLCGLEFFWGSPKGKNWPEHRFADLVNPQNPLRAFFWTDPSAWGKIEFSKEGHIFSLNQVNEIKEKKDFQQFSTHGNIQISYDLPSDANVSLVIDDKQGNRIRNLIGDVPRKAGRNIDWWDGKDDDGKEVSPGEYFLRGIFHKPFTLHYEFSFGNPGDPPWLTPDGRGGWLSNHENPLSITSDKNSIFVSAALAEGACTVMALDLNGRKKWGNGGIVGGMITRLGSYLYMVIGGTINSYGVPPGEIRLVRFNAENGDPVLFKDNMPYKVIYHFDISKPPPPKALEGEAIENGTLDAAWCQRQVMGIASWKNMLYCSLFFENKILILDDEANSIRTLSIDKPTGIVAANDGLLYAISGHRVVKIDQQGNITPFITTGLEAPIGIALDQNNQLYISDWGRAMNIKVFSKDGVFLREIGKKGGRPLNGPYDPRGMFLPFGLTVDPKNRIWVAEWDQSPRRISVWALNGEFLTEYCGSTFYAAMGCNINPLNPSEAIVMANKVDLDWQKGLWRLNSTLWRSTKSNALFGLDAEMYHQFLLLAKRKLLVSGFKNYLCISELNEDGSARPLSAMGQLSYFLKYNYRLPRLIANQLFSDPFQLEWAKSKFPSIFDGNAWETVHSREELCNLLHYESIARGYPLRHSFLWIDQNGDGRVQENEVEIFSDEETGGPIFKGAWWRPIIGQDLSTYWINQTKEFVTVWKLDCKGFNSVGAPVYSLKEAKRIFALSNPLPVADEPQGWCDAKGNILINHNPLEMFTQEGKLLWHYPNPWSGVHGSHLAPKAYPGRLIGPLYVIGSANLDNIGEIFCLSGNFGERYLFTTDGLYIGSLFKDARAAPDVLPQHQVRGIELTTNSAGGESFGGQFFKSSIDNNFYIIGPVSDARECSVIAKLEGLDTVKKLPQQPLIVSSNKEKNDRSTQINGLRPVLIIRPLPYNNDASSPPSADLFQWDFKEEVAHWSFDANHEASASLTFDQQYLYIGFKDVTDDTPMINNGKNPFQLFKTGDAVIFECGAQRLSLSEPIQEGDFRLLFSIYKQKPIAILYRYRVMGTKNPFLFSSPIGTTSIDQVLILDDCKIQLIRQRDKYSLYAAIPLKELGLLFHPGKTFYGDFGIIYSDKNGTMDSLRMYWSNKKTGMINDLSIESEIYPKEWAKLIIK
jgi:hypothetical protein